MGSLADPAEGPAVKTVHLLRHGQTEANAYWRNNEGGIDPGLFDTVLTPQGRQQATAAASVTANLSPPPQLLVSSPLTR